MDFLMKNNSAKRIVVVILTSIISVVFLSWFLPLMYRGLTTDHVDQQCYLEQVQKEKDYAGTIATINTPPNARMTGFTLENGETHGFHKSELQKLTNYDARKGDAVRKTKDDLYLYLYTQKRDTFIIYLGYYCDEIRKDAG